MRRVYFREAGIPSDVVDFVETREPGSPGGDEVVVSVEAFPINPADLLVLKGVYPRDPADPQGVGNECVGVVRAIGPKVRHLSPGDRVISLRGGNWGDCLVLPEDALLGIPEDVPSETAAGLKVNPATAWLLLQQAELRSGDWIIQNAANSSVGRAVIEIAKDRGLRTINLVRRRQLDSDLPALGADGVLVDDDLAFEQVQSLTGGQLPRLALDAVGGSSTHRLAKTLGERGTLVVYGAMSGEPMQIDPAVVVFRDLMIRGFWLTRLLASSDRAEIEALYEPVIALARRGAFRPRIARRFPLSEIGRALAHADQAVNAGKTMVFNDPT